MLLAAGLVGVLAIGSAAGGPFLAAGILICQLLFALAAVRQAPIPTAQVVGWFAALTGGAVTVWIAWRGTPDLAPVAMVLGPAFVVAIVVQLWHRGARAHLTLSMSLTVAAAVVAILPAAWVALRFTEGGAYAVGLGLLGVGVGVLAELVRVSSSIRRPVAVLLAGAAAAGLVMTSDDLGAMAEAVPAVGAVAIASFAAAVAVTAVAIVDRLATEPVGSSPEAPADDEGAVITARRQLVAALTPLKITLPIIAAAPIVYVLGRMLVG